MAKLNKDAFFTKGYSTCVHNNRSSDGCGECMRLDFETQKHNELTAVLGKIAEGLAGIVASQTGYQDDLKRFEESLRT